MQYIGQLDKNKLGKYKDKIKTLYVIITNERIEHIKKHHPSLINNELKFIKKVLEYPDYILEDRKNINTIIMIKNIINNNKNYIMIVKLNTNKDYKEKSNTIISFWNISKKKLGQYIRNGEIIFKKLDKHE